VKLVLELPVNIPTDQYSLVINGYSGLNRIFQDIAAIKYLDKGFSIFIQTDKPMYKAGQKGNLSKQFILYIDIIMTQQAL